MAFKFSKDNFTQIFYFYWHDNILRTLNYNILTTKNLLKKGYSWKNLIFLFYLNMAINMVNLRGIIIRNIIYINVHCPAVYCSAWSSQPKTNKVLLNTNLG